MVTNLQALVAEAKPCHARCVWAPVRLTLVSSGCKHRDSFLDTNNQTSLLCAGTEAPQHQCHSATIRGCQACLSKLSARAPHYHLVQWPSAVLPHCTHQRRHAQRSNQQTPACLRPGIRPDGARQSRPTTSTGACTAAYRQQEEKINRSSSSSCKRTCT